MKPPAGLGNHGKALWRQVTTVRGADLELDEREAALLALACRQRDDLAALETAIRKQGRMVRGSMGQPRLHPAIVEARQARLAIARLLGQMEIPDADGVPRTAASQKAAKAASAMHDELQRRRAARARRGHG